MRKLSDSLNDPEKLRLYVNDIVSNYKQIPNGIPIILYHFGRYTAFDYATSALGRTINNLPMSSSIRKTTELDIEFLQKCKQRAYEELLPKLIDFENWRVNNPPDNLPETGPQI